MLSAPSSSLSESRAGPGRPPTHTRRHSPCLAPCVFCAPGATCTSRGPRYVTSFPHVWNLMCGGRPLAAGADGTMTALELLFFFYYYCALCCYIRGSVYYSSLSLTYCSLCVRRPAFSYALLCLPLSLPLSLQKGGGTSVLCYACYEGCHAMIRNMKEEE